MRDLRNRSLAPLNRSNPFRAALVIGCQKAGSSLLHAVLVEALKLPQSHPAHRNKETHFFEDAHCEDGQPAANHAAIARCRRELRERHTANGWFIDGSPDNFQNANVWGVLQRVLPAARILLTLRDPIERAYSSWGQNVKARPTTGDRRTFDVAVRDELRDMWRRCTADGELGAALPTDDKRLALDVANGVEPWYVSDPAARSIGPLALTSRGARCAKDWRGSWLRWQPEMEARCGSCKQYLVRGFVVRKLDAWRSAYDGRVLVFAMEGVAADPVATASRIRDYLGLPTVRWSGESLETLRGYATKASWHKGRRLREGSEVPSWSEGVLTELYRDEVRQLRAREPAVVENWPRWIVPDSR